MKGLTDWDNELKRQLAEHDDQADETEYGEQAMTKSSSTDKLVESPVSKFKTSTSLSYQEVENFSIAVRPMEKKSSKNLRKGSDDIQKLSNIKDELLFKKRVSRILKNTEEEREKAERDLTPHVVTRFYRAPEVILMDKHYNRKIDIWSLGVMLLELIQMKKDNVSNYQNRKIMFVGKS